MQIASIQLYAKDVERLASFYVSVFDLEIVRAEDGFATLAGGGCFLSIHRCGKSARERGGEMTSITFAAEDVSAAKETLAKKGLKLGKIYEVDDFAFTKGRDPEGIAIHISSWAFSSGVPQK